MVVETEPSRSRTMQPFKFAEVPSHSAIAGTVTTLVSAWFLIAGAAMVASPTDTQMARGARVTVTPGPVHPLPQPVPAVAIAPEAHLTIVVEARRA
jgi:hypothetical protein